LQQFQNDRCKTIALPVKIRIKENTMKLKNRLEAIKAEFESMAPPEVLRVIHRANETLKHSGIIENVLTIGDHIPDVILPDTGGNTVRLSDALEKGPLVLTFFRGQW
jgi:hypothetical protein